MTFFFQLPICGQEGSVGSLLKLVDCLSRRVFDKFEIPIALERTLIRGLDPRIFQSKRCDLISISQSTLLWLQAILVLVFRIGRICSYVALRPRNCIRRKVCVRYCGIVYIVLRGWILFFADQNFGISHQKCYRILLFFPLPCWIE